MKGLLLKDFYIAAKICRLFFFLCVLFIAGSFFADGDFLFIAYPCMISGILPMTLIAYDEQEKWDKYAGGLPYTRGEIVSSKYLEGLSFSAIVILIEALVQGGKMLYKGSFVFDEYIVIILIMMLVSLSVPAILFPPVFKFGAIKGRLFYTCGIGALCGVTVWCGGDRFGKLFETAVGANVIIFILLLYALSWLLSVHFYKNREL